MNNKRTQAQEELEIAIVAAIRAFEEKEKTCLAIGIEVVREGRARLKVEALVVGKPSPQEKEAAK